MTATNLAPPVLATSRFEDKALLILCLRCSAAVASLDGGSGCEDAAHSCLRCRAITSVKDGIWRCLSSDTPERLVRFVSEYERIRAAEGRGRKDGAYYLALPYQDLSGRWSDQWRIRARTFEHVRRRVVEPLAMRLGRPLRVLDLGAGNGWLSYRLALLGHAPVAVDLLTNDQDGLGAGGHFATELDSMFPRVQASLDGLPFADKSFDVAIFNASFHYSEDGTRTLAEAMRCTRAGGVVVIADTPWYADEESGLRMVKEKHVRFRAAYGIASDSLGSVEFVTPERLYEMAEALGLEWQVSSPFYGIGWALRPLRAWLLRRRPPSRFRVFLAEVRA